ncbi:Kef-type K+ transport system membrane component KefB [Chryseobacterium ginsenosidimutans]|nr:Kef-type K+ transport system membrane component KefB [Chryseobacterium ginsenosidimutans]
MRRNIFNSKKLYITNIVISLILFLLTALTLYSFIFFEKYSFANENQSRDLILYFCYFIVYAIILILLLSKPQKAVLFLSIMYFLLIILNFYDFGIHYYLKYKNRESRYTIVVISTVLILIFSLLIYLNNKKKFHLDLSELDKIGTHND